MEDKAEGFSRRDFLKTIGVVGASAFLASACERADSVLGSEFQEIPISAKEISDIFGRGFPPPTKILSEENYAKYQQNKEELLVEITKHTEYRSTKHNIFYYFYYQEGQLNWSQKQLDGTLDFLKKHCGKRFGPVKNAHMFIGDFDPDRVSYTKCFNGATSFSIVNVDSNINKYPLENAFWVEFAQTALFAKRGDKVLEAFQPQESISNELGFAIDSVLKNESYSLYKQRFPMELEVYGDNKIVLNGLDANSFDELTSIFDKEG